jgi:hypothetical protein
MRIKPSFILANPPDPSYRCGMDTYASADAGYEAPQIVELGTLVELTALGQGGFNKPCSAADGMSGTIGNCSGGGIGS